MLGNYIYTWDVSLSEIYTTEHRTDLTPEVKPVKSEPYRAGPKDLRAGNDEVKRRLRAGVKHPAQSRWASFVVNAPKPDVALQF